MFRIIILLSVLMALNTSCMDEKKTVESTSAKALDLEDCDDKVKKEVEITPENITLNGENKGCTLDD